MATAAAFRKIALSLEGTVDAPHFDRTAFKVSRIYATLAPDGRTANLKFAPEEQELKCMVAADAFAPVPNAWGKQGWTTVMLAQLTDAELKSALEMAWKHALPKSKARTRRLPPKRGDLQFQIPRFGNQCHAEIVVGPFARQLEAGGDINLARAFEDAMGP